MAYEATKDQLEAFQKEHDYLKSKLELGKEILWLTQEECIKAGPDVAETLGLIHKAMEAHGKKYGVENVADGVLFYFDLDANVLADK